MLEVEVFNAAVEFLARRIHVLKLFISVLLVVDVLINAREFALHTGKVLAHVEDCEVVAYKGEPFVILLVLDADGVVADVLEAVLLNVE